MKRIIGATMLAGTLISTGACGNNGGNEDTNATASIQNMTPPTGQVTDEETSTSGSADLGTLDEAKLTSFVVAFRTGYSELAEERDDESIKVIVLQSCDAIGAGVDEQQVTEQIRTLAAHNRNEPTQAQAEQIYDLVTPACPS
jgi:hypothetical protein